MTSSMRPLPNTPITDNNCWRMSGEIPTLPILYLVYLSWKEISINPFEQRRIPHSQNSGRLLTLIHRQMHCNILSILIGRHLTEHRTSASLYPAQYQNARRASSMQMVRHQICFGHPSSPLIDIFIHFNSFTSHQFCLFNFLDEDH